MQINRRKASKSDFSIVLNIINVNIYTTFGNVRTKMTKTRMKSCKQIGQTLTE